MQKVKLKIIKQLANVQLRKTPKVIGQFNNGVWKIIISKMPYKERQQSIKDFIQKYRDSYTSKFAIEDDSNYISISDAAAIINTSRTRIRTAVQEGIIRSRVHDVSNQILSRTIFKPDVEMLQLLDDFFLYLKEAGAVKSEIDPVTGKVDWYKLNFGGTKSGKTVYEIKKEELKQITLDLIDFFGDELHGK